MAYESYVLVCGGTACCSSGGTSVVEAFKNELEAAGLKDKASAQPLLERADAIVAEAAELERQTLEAVNNHIEL